MPLTSELRRITEDRATLTLGEASSLMRRLLAGDGSDIEIAALLGALAARRETAAEIAGFALAMRGAATPLPLTPAEQAELVDTCGTGGDGSGTFNISTAAALVAAAAGAKVAKHGNRAVTSRCGSADVLEALGIPIDLSPERAAEALRRHGFCFLLAPSHHTALRAVMPVRRALGVRTIFNVLGPLLNPAGARRQVMGVYAPRLVPLVAEAMTLLGVVHAFVVHGTFCAATPSPHQISTSGMDELSLSGPSLVAEVRSGTTNSTVQTVQITPEGFGFTEIPISALAGGNAHHNAAMLSSIFGLDGQAEQGPGRDVVVLNAAAVLVAAGRTANLADGIALARETIDTGAVAQRITALRGA